MSKLSSVAPHMPAAKLLQFAKQFTIEAFQSQSNDAPTHVLTNSSSIDTSLISPIANQFQSTSAAVSSNSSFAQQANQSVHDNHYDQPGSHTAATAAAAVGESDICDVQSSSIASRHQNTSVLRNDNIKLHSIANSMNRKRKHIQDDNALTENSNTSSKMSQVCSKRRVAAIKTASSAAATNQRPDRHIITDAVSDWSHMKRNTDTFVHLLIKCLSIINSPVDLCNAFTVCKSWHSLRNNPSCYQHGFWCDFTRHQWAKRSKLCGLLRFIRQSSIRQNIIRIYDSNPYFTPLPFIGPKFTIKNTKYGRIVTKKSKVRRICQPNRIRDKSGHISGNDTTRNRYSILVACRGHIVMLIESQSIYTLELRSHFTHQQAAAMQGLTFLPTFMPRLRQPNEIVTFDTMPLQQSCWICKEWQDGLAKREIEIAKTHPIECPCSIKQQSESPNTINTSCRVHAHTRYELAYAYQN
jgi:hypothetical protein